jgi:hypothetical protein
MDPLEHLIDLDTDSMETAPDVRVYFWYVGYETLFEDGCSVPVDSEERKEFDSRVVRAGREYLKEMRDEGFG